VRFAHGSVSEYLPQRTQRAQKRNRIISREDAKATKDQQHYEFKTRNPKFETISNGQKSESSKQARFGFRNWDLNLRVCFGPRGFFRYSDFGFYFGGVSWFTSAHHPE